jgi:hypothetical protein
VASCRAQPRQWSFAIDLCASDVQEAKALRIQEGRARDGDTHYNLILHSKMLTVFTISKSSVSAGKTWEEAGIEPLIITIQRPRLTVRLKINTLNNCTDGKATGISFKG